MAEKVSTHSLLDRYRQLKEEHPRLRIRNAADQLGVSELELLELQLGQGVVRLKGDAKDMLHDMHRLSYVMALTRNDYAVHERKGVYENISFTADGKMGVAVNPDIDLRFFMSQWRYAYAVRMETGRRPLYSFQFFNKKGKAVHKIYLTSKSNPKAYDELLEKYRARNQQKHTRISKRRTKADSPASGNSVDVAAFQQDWRNLQDTHHFFDMLKKHGVTRTQAMRLAPDGYTRQLSNDAVVRMLELASKRQTPIMVFVGNEGCIQIHTGPVKNIVPMDGWINVMDPAFNLHLKLDGIAETWETRKPTKDGVVTGIEVFDQEGELIVYCFGKRKPGIPELTEWRELVAQLD